MAARDFLHDDRAIRPAIFTLVLAAHLAALLIPLKEKHERIRDHSAPSRLILIPSASDDRGLLRIPDALPPAVAVQPPSLPRLAPFQSADEGLPASSATATALPDWKQSGADAAADAARDNYRALGPKPQEPQVKLPPSPFGAPPRHKFGDMDKDAFSNAIIWLGKNCFMRPGDSNAQPSDPFAGVPMFFCSGSIGKAEPRGDLFEHLRKTPPVP
ncbi:hypothetical protein [Steroidobacter cummioxidans]|uniref:hypothetical protein n=1 Tax=Steroidobacter cummioxidans TaxID=1803913 RepID=UPI000E30F9B1|nr:hypothetical protein [Steroidobacter cummioxidans]